MQVVRVKVCQIMMVTPLPILPNYKVQNLISMEKNS